MVQIYLVNTIMYKLLAIICLANGVCNPMVDSRGISYPTMEMCDAAAEQRFNAVSKGLTESIDFQSIMFTCLPAEAIDQYLD